MQNQNTAKFQVLVPALHQTVTMTARGKPTKVISADESNVMRYTAKGQTENGEVIQVDIEPEATPRGAVKFVGTIQVWNAKGKRIASEVTGRQFARVERCFAALLKNKGVRQAVAG